MKKSDLARAQFHMKFLEQTQENNLEKLLDILSAAFSALATAEPSLALSVLAQMDSQKSGIEELIVEREGQEHMFVSQMIEHMSDSMEFEEEDELN